MCSVFILFFFLTPLITGTGVESRGYVRSVLTFRSDALAMNVNNSTENGLRNWFQTMYLNLTKPTECICIANDTHFHPCFVLLNQALLFPKFTDARPTCKWDAMFVNVRHYNGFYVCSLFHRISRRFIHRKPRKAGCPCLYYANSGASRQIILLGGDISVNPGPLAKQKSAKCEECEKTIRRNQQRVTCNICFGLQHIKCAKLKSVLSNWMCGNCLISVLPFHGYSIEDDAFNDQAGANEFTPEQSPQEALRILQEQATHLRIMHLNTQSMVSTFNEFLITINEYPLDVVTLSETWLKDNSALLDFATVPNYTTVFRNRESIKGGGVGAYIRNSINFKHRKDIENFTT